ncbi:MAG: F0F1 ATP synthase subunit B family protein, partial [Archangium sp.]
LAEQKTAIAEARRDAQEMLRRNQQEVEKFREELMAKSRKEAEEFKATATREIQEQKSKAIAEVKSMTVDLAMEVAGKLLNERMDDPKHRALAEQFVQGLPAKGTSTPRA